MIGWVHITFSKAIMWNRASQIFFHFTIFYAMVKIILVISWLHAAGNNAKGETVPAGHWVEYIGVLKCLYLIPILKSCRVICFLLMKKVLELQLYWNETKKCRGIVPYFLSSSYFQWWIIWGGKNIWLSTFLVNPQLQATKIEN